ncbi:hypothetical protein [Nocardia miyunensis]|uniref:hypothetical protein n=1 Tax=Nocardia miyunensis TaxID=282684 RepID=UPI0008333DBA|nr:hypothetical protein [Nocardia miyunensis]
MRMRTTTTVLILLVAVVSGCSSPDSAPAATGTKPLIGLLRFTPGNAHGDKVSGTWFRMVQPGGTFDGGPYMPNGDSAAQGGTTTLLDPGTSGGLRTDSFQSEPNPGFASGNSLAASITKPTKFFGVEFGISTNPVDPQTRRTVSAPTVLDTGGKLSADLSSWAASWNDQEFNQGAPKPPEKQDAQVAGSEQVRKVWDWVAQKWFDQPRTGTPQGPLATGTYDAVTRAFTLQWTSLIVGGPFNGFTGVWHLEGIFEPAAAQPGSAPSTPPAPTK